MMSSASLASRICVVFLAILTIAILGDLINYAVDPGSYTFGTEVGGPLYRSARSFVGISITQALVCMAGLFAGRLVSKVSSVLTIRVVALILLIGSLASFRIISPPK